VAPGSGACSTANQIKPFHSIDSLSELPALLSNDFFEWARMISHIGTWELSTAIAFGSAETAGEALVFGQNNSRNLFKSILLKRKKQKIFVWLYQPHEQISPIIFIKTLAISF
jgi:hypothetical protein